MTIEKLGVRVANPETNIVLEGTSFAELMLFEHLRVENLRRCVVAIGLANPNGANELLAETHVQLQLIIDATGGRLHDLGRVAREQGLRFEIVPAPGDLH